MNGRGFVRAGIAALGFLLAAGIRAASASSEAPQPPQLPPQSFWSGSGPNSGEVSAVAADTARPGRIYAAGAGGIFLSDDGGVLWRRAGESSLRSRCRALAALASGRVLAACAQGVFRSDAAGAGWERLAGESPADANGFAVAGEAVWAATSAGVLASVDGGASWTRGTARDRPFSAVAFDADRDLVYASSLERVFRSRDRGATWIPGAPAGATIRGLAVVAGESGANPVLLAATDGAGVRSSSDGGDTWSPTPLRDAIVQSIASDPANSSALAAAGPGGIYRSSNGGRAWRLVRTGGVSSVAWDGQGNLLAAGERGVVRLAAGSGPSVSVPGGVPAASVLALARDPSRPSRLYAAAREGLFEWDDAQDGPWMSVPLARNRVAANGFSEAGPELLVATDAGLAVRIAGGESWELRPSLPLLALENGPFSGDHLFGSVRGRLVRSDDGGVHWKETPADLERAFVISISADPHDPKILYAGTSGEGLFQSRDGGLKWSALSPQLRRTCVRAIVVDPDARGVIWLGTDEGVIGSGDGGRSWSSFHQGLPHAIVYSLALDSESGGVLYAGTTAGVFRQEPGGVWSALPGDPGVPAVTALLIDHACGRLLMGTFGAGVFAASLP